jgi:hypothetical protein
VEAGRHVTLQEEIWVLYRMDTITAEEAFYDAIDQKALKPLIEP